MKVMIWSHCTADPAAREGACPRSGDPLDDDKKTMRVEGVWVHRGCLRPYDDHHYAPREVVA